MLPSRLVKAADKRKIPYSIGLGNLIVPKERKNEIENDFLKHKKDWNKEVQCHNCKKQILMNQVKQKRIPEIGSVYFCRRNCS